MATHRSTVPFDGNMTPLYGYDRTEEVFKVAGYVWDTDTMAWVRMTQPLIETEELTVAGEMEVTNWPLIQVVSSPNEAQVVYEDGDVLYVCKAAIGTALATAAWQIKKVNCATGVIVQWCDGNANYDNTATNLATVAGHSYS